jgi:hypothetical protein
MLSNERKMPHLPPILISAIGVIASVIAIGMMFTAICLYLVRPHARSLTQD